MHSYKHIHKYLYTYIYSGDFAAFDNDLSSDGEGHSDEGAKKSKVINIYCKLIDQYCILATISSVRKLRRVWYIDTT